jgi:hypothetical protein
MSNAKLRKEETERSWKGKLKMFLKFNKELGGA